MRVGGYFVSSLPAIGAGYIVTSQGYCIMYVCAFVLIFLKGAESSQGLLGKGGGGGVVIPLTAARCHQYKLSLGLEGYIQLGVTVCIPTEYWLHTVPCDLFCRYFVQELSACWEGVRWGRVSQLTLYSRRCGFFFPETPDFSIKQKTQYTHFSCDILQPHPEQHGKQFRTTLHIALRTSDVAWLADTLGTCSLESRQHRRSGIWKETDLIRENENTKRNQNSRRSSGKNHSRRSLYATIKKHSH